MDESAKIATCLICTLAQCIRKCDECAFNIGLATKAEQEHERLRLENEKKTIEILGFYD
jgi:hypothetical protein